MDPALAFERPPLGSSIKRKVAGNGRSKTDRGKGLEQAGARFSSNVKRSRNLEESFAETEKVKEPDKGACKASIR